MSHLSCLDKNVNFHAHKHSHAFLFFRDMFHVFIILEAHANQHASKKYDIPYLYHLNNVDKIKMETFRTIYTHKLKLKGTRGCR